MPIYCTYLTVYNGNLMPKFYIGYTTMTNIEKGYHGSVGSKRYRDIWREELEKRPELFKTIVLTTHDTRAEALDRESKFQEALNVHRNPMYINMAVSNKKFHCKGVIRTQEYRRRVSENNRRRWADPETKEEWMQSLRKAKSTEEYRRAQSERSRKLAEDPAYRKAISERVQRDWDREGERERRSDALKRTYIDNPELREAKKRFRWWTDGVTSVFCEICPDGFVRGRIYKGKAYIKEGG